MSTTTVKRSSRISARQNRACSGLEAAGLMFQQRKAWMSAGSSSLAASSIWLKLGGLWLSAAPDR